MVKRYSGDKVRDEKKNFDENGENIRWRMIVITKGENKLKTKSSDTLKDKLRSYGKDIEKIHWDHIVKGQNKY